jgi:hypothetical protein
MLLTGERVLFDGLIDYAGLFPPTSLDVEEAVAEYSAARTGGHAWILGRFLCPDSRLEELAGVLTRTMRPNDPSWAVGVVLGGRIAEAATAASAFDREMSPAAAVDAVEVRLPTEVSDGRPPAAASVELRHTVRAALSVGPAVRPYLEVAVGPGWEMGIESAVAAIAVARDSELRSLGAKIRCGGLTADAFPSASQVASFMVACSRHDVPFKATAGLHHPIRHVDDDLGVMRHGFLNLLFAAGLAAEGEDEVAVAAILSETDRSAFSLLASRFAWRGRGLLLPALKRLRTGGLVSYGSCSFEEPIDDLVDMRLIEA